MNLNIWIESRRNIRRMRKKVVWIFVEILILILIALCIATALILPKTKYLNPTEGEIQLYVADKGPMKDYDVYHSKKQTYHPIEASPGQSITLYMLNGREDVKSIYILITNQVGEIVEEGLYQKEKSTYTMEFGQDTVGQYDVSFVLIGENNLEFYVANENVFLNITGDARVKDQSVTLLRDLKLESDIEAPITFSYPFTWNFNSHTFSTNQTLLFSSRETGTMQVQNTDGNVIVTGNATILLDAPHMDFIWGDKESFSFDYVEQYMNVLSFNGQPTDEMIGGDGEAILLSGSLALSSATTAPFVIDGNYIYLYQGYTDTISLEDAKFSYELSEEGSAEIIKKDNTYYCVTTNAQGKSWGYKIFVMKKEYQLPVVYIETENATPITSKDEKINGSFSLDYNGMETFANIDSSEMVIRGRGHSSWKLEKKPYKIKFESKVSLFGLTPAKEWVLQANHVDKSLIRNKLAMNMGAVLDNVLFTPHSYNVDVFVNGTYMGVYTLTEQIEVKDGRIPGEKDSTAVDTDYLIELGGDEVATSFGTNMFDSPLYNWIEIKNPDTDVLSKEQFDYIKNYMYQADIAAKELDGYEEYIDIPSLIDFFLLTEFSYNVDGAFRRSDFIMKKAGGKLYMATYWDYDYAFGNFWRDSLDLDEWICLGNENTKNYVTDSWITYLLEDPAFTAQLKTRWEEVGEELYRTAMATIDEAEQNVSASATENFIRWPNVLGNKIQYEHNKTVNISTYEGQLQYLRDFIQKRYEWMDKTIDGM